MNGRQKVRYPKHMQRLVLKSTGFPGQQCHKTTQQTRLGRRQKKAEAAATRKELLYSHRLRIAGGGGVCLVDFGSKLLFL